MDTEQLRMILDTLRTMGDTGQSAFIWWLVFDKALPLLVWLVTFAGLLWIAMKLIERIGISGIGEQVRDILGVGSPGVMTPNEVRETLERVRELAAKRGA